MRASKVCDKQHRPRKDRLHILQHICECAGFTRLTACASYKPTHAHTCTHMTKFDVLSVNAFNYWDEKERPLASSSGDGSAEAVERVPSNQVGTYLYLDGWLMVIMLPPFGSCVTSFGLYVHTYVHDSCDQCHASAVPGLLFPARGLLLDLTTTKILPCLLAIGGPGGAAPLQTQQSRQRHC